MDILGDKCVKCGFNDKRALQFDHINGGGLKDRIRFKAAQTMYKFYINNPELARKCLQILCANCNTIKIKENKECSIPRKGRGKAILRPQIHTHIF